ncbi:MAG: hypothetical protein J6I84_03500 [Bacilli bacterium]|nr:hypothetical protein [Bacilli bacterium]
MSDILHMKVGANIGEVLLDIAQTKIKEGKPEEGIKVYTESLPGFTPEDAIRLLKGEVMLVSCPDGSGVWLSEGSEEKLLDWKWIVKDRVRNIGYTLDSIREAKKKVCNYDIEDFALRDPVVEYFGEDRSNVIAVHHLAARIIAGDERAEIYEPWLKIEGLVERDEGLEYEKTLYFTVRYVKCIKYLHIQYLDFLSSYDWLLMNGFIERPEFLEETLERSVRVLLEFADPKKGYHHPLCNDKLRAYKEKLRESIERSKPGQEYIKCGSLAKNIMDGYDAGWLSPEGIFYGANGPTSALLHMRLAENIMPGKKDPERYLEQIGWLKIHDNSIYGYFTSRKNELGGLYCPTPEQIKAVCDYVDKHYRGVFYTEAITFGSRTSHSEPYQTHKVRQMDEVALHNAFRL